LTEFPIRASQFRPKAETADFQIDNLKTAPLAPPLNTNHKILNTQILIYRALLDKSEFIPSLPEWFV